MKKILCLFIALLMLLPLFTVFVTANATSTAEVNDTSWGDSYYYRDSYFASDASLYNPSLASMSFILTRAGFAYSGEYWTKQYSTLFDLFGEIGFTDCRVNDDFKVYPSTDSMGVGVAHKTMSLNGKTCTVIAIVPRSGNYEAEWANNFTLGMSGDAAGFSASANKIQSFVNQYAADYGSSFEGEIKLWIVGYSRGAAVANLVAGRITKSGKIGNYNVAKENIFAYTFETPAGLSTDTVSLSEAKTYTNIHNIITANDLVTKVAPEDWGFIRYGIDESVIPETRTSENEALFDFALSLVNESFVSYTSEGKKVFASETFEAKKITSDLSALSKLGTWVKENGYYKWEAVDSQNAKEILVVSDDKTMSQFLDDLIHALCLGITSRYSYAKNVEDLIRLVISETLGSNYQTKVLLIAKMTLTEELQKKKESILMAAATANYLALEDVLSGVFHTVLVKSGLDTGAYAKLPQQIAALVPILAKTLIADFVISGGSDILTLIDNLDILFQTHESAQVFAWLRALDSNYNSSLKSKTNATVKDVQVLVEKKVETKKVLFVKTKVTSYQVTITPVTDVPVQSVSYRTTLIGKMTNGTSFSRSLDLNYLYVSVIDANGNTTHWEYRGGQVIQID